MSEANIQLVSGHAISEDFADLVACHLAGELSDAQQEQLNAELIAQPNRRGQFVDMCIQAHLFATCIDPEFTTEECLDDFSDSENSLSVQIQADASSPIVAPSPTILHTSLTYLSSGWPVAYLIATVIFGIGALISAFTYVSQPVEVATHSLTQAAERQLASEPLPRLVGRITGLVDCKWADPDTMPVSADVCLDHKYELNSGLMEITYDTGAKILLQGPVIFEIESENGGFLSIGKLTAKVEVKRAEGFSVRTPIATVTDLGTEFGVEVSKSGSTAAHVFRGVVEVQPVASDGQQGQAIQCKRPSWA